MSYDPQPRMRVVCIDESDAESRALSPGVVFPAKGTVYTIKKVYRSDEGPYIRLQEIDQRVLLPNRKRGCASWWYLHFKPLDERRLDIFRSLIQPVVVREGEPA